MREIKFRAWWKDYREMHHPVSIDNCLKDDCVILMQYTGLKDKNGVCVYEGDIIKVNKLTYDKKNEFNAFVGLVEFYMGSFHLSVSKMLLLCYGEDIEIIGNIYENSELLRED